MHYFLDYQNVNVMKPVYKEDATKAIQDIMANMENKNIAAGQSWIMDRKQELIQKMKEDTDNKEYPIMFNALIIMLISVCIYHIFINGMVVLVALMLLGIVYYIFVQKKLKNAILKLRDDQRNIDDYMMDGYMIKDSRFTAVKFAFLTFFPFICYLALRILEDSTNTLPVWQNLLIAFGISSVAWFIFFSDDQSNLESLESEINGLIALGSES